MLKSVSLKSLMLWVSICVYGPLTHYFHSYVALYSFVLILHSMVRERVRRAQSQHIGQTKCENEIENVGCFGEWEWTTKRRTHTRARWACLLLTLSLFSPSRSLSLFLFLWPEPFVVTVYLFMFSCVCNVRCTDHIDLLLAFSLCFIIKCVCTRAHPILRKIIVRSVCNRLKTNRQIKEKHQ